MARCFGGKIWIKSLRYHVFRHSDSPILDVDLHIEARR